MLGETQAKHFPSRMPQESLREWWLCVLFLAFVVRNRSYFTCDDNNIPGNIKDSCMTSHGDRQQWGVEAVLCAPGRASTVFADEGYISAVNPPHFQPWNMCQTVSVLPFSCLFLLHNPLKKTFSHPLDNSLPPPCAFPQGFLSPFCGRFPPTP